MAVSFLNTASAAGASSGALTVSAFTPNSGADFLLGAVGGGFASDNAANGGTWNSNAMSELTGVVSGADYAKALGYIAPGTSSADMALDWSFDGSPELAACALAFSGVDQTTAMSLDNSITGSGNISEDVTTVSGDYAVLIVSGYNITCTAGTGCTLIASRNEGGTQQSVFVIGRAATGTTTTLNATISGTRVASAVRIIAAAGGGSTESMTADLSTSTFSLAGTTSVNFPANANLVTGTFDIVGEAAVGGAATEQMTADVTWGIDVKDGEVLRIYVAGFSTLDTGVTLGATSSSASFTNISGEATWGATLNPLTGYVLPILAEPVWGTTVENETLTFSLSATLAAGFRIEATPSGVVFTGGDSSKPIKLPEDYTDDAKTFVRNLILNAIAKGYDD